MVANILGTSSQPEPAPAPQHRLKLILIVTHVSLLGLTKNGVFFRLWTKLALLFPRFRK
jgi:hypothetical protein